MCLLFIVAIRYPVLEAKTSSTAPRYAHRHACFAYCAFPQFARYVQKHRLLFTGMEWVQIRDGRPDVGGHFSTLHIPFIAHVQEPPTEIVHSIPDVYLPSNRGYALQVCDSGGFFLRRGYRNVLAVLHVSCLMLTPQCHRYR